MIIGENLLFSNQFDFLLVFNFHVIKNHFVKILRIYMMEQKPKVFSAFSVFNTQYTLAKRRRKKSLYYYIYNIYNNIMEISLHLPEWDAYVLKTENTENAWGGKGNVTRFGGKRLHVRCKKWRRFGKGTGRLDGKPPSRLSQVAHNGFYFGLQEGAPTGIVAQRFKLGNQQGATLYPSVEGLHGGVGGTVRLIEQSQFGLAVRTWCEHVLEFFELWILLFERYKYTKFSPLCKIFSNLFHLYRDISGHPRTLADIGGHCAFGMLYLCSIKISSPQRGTELIFHPQIARITPIPFSRNYFIRIICVIGGWKMKTQRPLRGEKENTNTNF